MVELQPDNHTDIQDLLTWAERARRQGIGDPGLGIGAPFIPNPDIDAYLDIRRIKKLLAALFPDGAPHVYPEIIRNKYAKVFLILLLTGNGRFIEEVACHDNLCDRRLPFLSRPAHFPLSTADIFHSFYDRQWEFCARTFQYETKQQFHKREILPIVLKKKLGGGGSAMVHMIELHPAYNKLGCEGPCREGSTDQNTNTFVLKTYNTPDAERYYDSEVNGFSHLNYGGKPPANIIRFHGSFVRDGTYNVLLEYADRGTLEEYFNTIQPPTSGESIKCFWRELFKTLAGLVAIHSVPQSDSASSVFQGWHQDVKPSNILVKSKKGGSPYNCDFKLADLGLSHFKKHVPSQGEVTDKDTYGTRAYGAPECYRADSDLENIPLLVRQDVDIWSLGCVFSEAAVWVVRGKDGLSEYRRRRGLKTVEIPDFRDGDCFHDGLQVLPIVTETHGTLAEDMRRCDHVTGATVDMVTKLVLVDQGCRPSARCFKHQTEAILHDAEKKLQTSAPTAGTGSAFGTGAHLRPRTPQEPPPGHVQRGSSNSHSQLSPSRTYAGNSVIASYGEDKTHRREPADDSFDKRAFQPPSHGDRTIRHQTEVLANDLSYDEHGDQGVFSLKGPNRALSENPLLQDSPSSPYQQTQLSRRQRQRQTPSDPLSGPNTRDCHDVFDQEQQETYNVNQRNSFTALQEGVSRCSNATSAQDLHNASRHHSGISSGTRPLGLVSTDLSTFLPAIRTQIRPPPLFLSVTDAQQWKNDRKDKRSGRLSDQYLLADLKEKNPVFLIDNSNSMLQHSKKIHDLFGLLSYMIKKSNPGGIELHFTMCTRRQRAKRTTPLLKTLEEVEYIGVSNIKKPLGDILLTYYEKLRDPRRGSSAFSSAFLTTRSSRPVQCQNVYIFTDGVWQPGCDPGQMIGTLVRNLEENSMQREQFGIQFIRFGNDPDGIGRLNHLDSGLGLSMDIVDTEPSDGNVWKMLFGAANDWFDDDDVDAGDTSVVSSPIADTAPGANTFHRTGRRNTTM